MRPRIPAARNADPLTTSQSSSCVRFRGSQATGNGTPVQLWQCHYGKNQRFNVLPTGQIKEVESGKCLIAKAANDRAPVVLDNCVNSPMEKWNVGE